MGKNIIKCISNICSTKSFVEADKTRIYQIISNLLKNAIKFGNKGGTITVTAEVSTNKVEEEQGAEEVVMS